MDGTALPRPPVDAVQGGDGITVPTLIGSNRDEWRLFDVFLPPSTATTMGRLLDRFGDLARRIHAAYREGRGDRPAVRSPDTEAWIDLIGDVVFRLPVIRLAEAVARHAPVWKYRFDWATPAFDGRLGAAHALELPFVWNQLDLPVSQLLLGGDAAAARSLGARMHEAWAAFVRGGEPAAAGLPAWPRYDEARRATMLLDREPRVADDPDAAMRERWSALAGPPPDGSSR